LPRRTAGSSRRSEPAADLPIAGVALSLLKFLTKPYGKLFIFLLTDARSGTML